MSHYSLTRTQRDVSYSRHLSRNQRDAILVLLVVIVAYLSYQWGYDRGRADEGDGVVLPPAAVWLR